MQIVCATDLVPGNDAPIERARLIADQLQADLSLLHVVVPGESPQSLEQALQAAREQMQARVNPPLWLGQRTPAWAVQTGAPARIIVDTAARWGARLLVLGPHRKRPLRDALEGTIAEKALATKRYPVLMVRNQAVRAYRRVLVALDLSDASTSAIHAAESLVIAPEASARVIHAHEPPYQSMLAYAGVEQEAAVVYAQKWKHEAQRSVHDLLDCESGDARRYDVQVAQLPAAVGILQAVEQFSPDLLVMGTHGGGSLRRALVGSVANRVLHETNCDALIVPEGSFDALGQRWPVKHSARMGVSG
jgi:nucleotide-binding universal stress UspA family protein